MSQYAGELAAPLGGEVTRAQLQREQRRLLGVDVLFDGDFQVGPNGDYLLVEGARALEQAADFRLLTNPGEFKTAPEYGGGLRAAVKSKNTSTTRALLRTRCIATLKRDDRIDDAEVTVEELDSTPGVIVTRTLFAKGEVLTFEPLAVTGGTNG